MAVYHDISTQLWQDLLELPIEQKLVYIFLFSNSFCRPSGLYQISPKVIEIFTGVKEGAWKPLASPLKPLIIYDFETEEVWVRGKLKHFRNIFKNPNILKSVERDLELLKSPSLKALFLEKYEESLEGLVSPLRHRQGHRQGLKEIGCGKEKKNVVELPTRDNHNGEKETDFYPANVKSLMANCIADLKKKSGPKNNP